MITLGIHNGHDAAACLMRDGELVAFCKEERLTRVKNDGKRFDLAAIDEVLRIGRVARRDLDAVCFTRKKFPFHVYRRMPLHKRMRHAARRFNGRNRDITLEGEMSHRRLLAADRILDMAALRATLGLSDACLIDIVNHDYAHILGAFRYTDWPAEALYLSCDGGGDGTQYSAYHFNAGRLELLIGGDDCVFRQPQNPGASIGLVYAYTTEYLGFRKNRHEGKVTGLAAFGEPLRAQELAAQFRIDADGTVVSAFPDLYALRDFLHEIYAGLTREQVAATVQHATEAVVLRWVTRLREIRPSRYLGLAGGVFANVLLNQKLAELPGIAEIFVVPSMSDEGLALGAAIQAEIGGNALTRLPRGRLASIYQGAEHPVAALRQAAETVKAYFCGASDAATAAARLLAQGRVGAIFSQRMEMGPRALGARSILAAPVERVINDRLNERLERTEFMPFAPCVLEEDADRVFTIDPALREACRFMTVTTPVRPEFRERIPAVVHIDGTARPQIVRDRDNPLYAAIIRAYRDLTGIPCLINTSFNAHEEPIINTPGEAVNALREDRVDFLVCTDGLIVANEVMRAEAQDAIRGCAMAAA